jgi:hypothetical protein
MPVAFRAYLGSCEIRFRFKIRRNVLFVQIYLVRKPVTNGAKNKRGMVQVQRSNSLKSLNRLTTAIEERMKGRQLLDGTVG